MHRFLSLVISITASVAAPAAERAVGEAHRTVPLASAAARRTDHQPKIDVTLWYPAAPGTVEKPAVIGPPGKPYFRIASLAVDAKPASGRRPVVLLSHGFGGSAEMMGWLGAAIARAGYIVIGVDHPGNHDGDTTDIGSIAWWERPRDLIAALAAMAHDATFGLRIDRTRVGAAGFSIGGMTVLALGGARIDPLNYDRFCAANPGDGVCQKPPERPDQRDIGRAEGVRLLGLTEAQAHAGEDTTLPGLRAILSIAPPVQMLAPDSLGAVHVPVVLIAGDADTQVPPDHHAALAAKAIEGARFIRLPGVAHYSFLATCTEAVRGSGGACDHAPDQEEAHRVAIAKAVALFRKTLGTPR